MLSPFEKQYLDGKETGQYTYEPDADFVREQLCMVINEIFNDRKIYAIKALRNLTALGLKDSKEVVEHLQEKTLTQDLKTLKYENKNLTAEVSFLRKKIHELSSEKQYCKNSAKSLEKIIKSNEKTIGNQEKSIEDLGEIIDNKVDIETCLKREISDLKEGVHHLIETIKIITKSNHDELEIEE